MNRCRKCGYPIEYGNRLWCKKHSQEVTDELRGLHNHGFDYYFDFYQRNKYQSWETFEKLSGTTAKKSRTLNFLKNLLKGTK